MNKAFFALIAPLVIGCGSSGSPTTTGTPNDGPLAPPEVGVQLKSSAMTLAAGAEKYSCWSYTLPEGDPIDLVGIVNQTPSAGVHHFAVFTNSAKETDPGPWDCETMGISWGLVSGGGIGTPPVDFPAGTAMHIAGGTHLILQLHLLNASNDPIQLEEARVNLVGTKQTSGLQPVGLLIAGTLDITIPAHASNVDVTGGCTFDEKDQTIFAVFPHMHKLGRHIKGEVIQSGGKVETISDEVWDFKDQGLYKVSGTATVGDQFKVTCTFDNPGASDVHFGLSTKDEMCLNVFYHYPSNNQSKYCGLQ